MPKHFYLGDGNPENGGYWFTVDNLKYGYSDVIRITPCSDAGGPDNAFWIERLTVNLPNDESETRKVLSCVGTAPDELPKGSTGKRMLIDACLAYGKYDQDESTCVQIGPDEHAREPVKPDIRLRANWSIGGYVRKHYLSGG